MLLDPNPPFTISGTGVAPAEVEPNVEDEVVVATGGNGLLAPALLKPVEEEPAGVPKAVAVAVVVAPILLVPMEEDLVDSPKAAVVDAAPGACEG